VDIGHATEVSPYAYIRILDDEHVNLGDVAEITGEMEDSYTATLEPVSEDIYPKAKMRMEQLLEAKREAARDFAAGMDLLFGHGWRTEYEKIRRSTR
jgi:hypothetical protein